MILLITFVTGLFSTLYYVNLKDLSIPTLPKVMYRSECVLIIQPSDQNNIDGTNLESMVLRIRSDIILRSIFSQFQMQNSEFRNIQYETFSNMFRGDVATIDASNAGLRISMETADPKLSQNMQDILNLFISKLINYLKDNTIESLESEKSFLHHNFEVANDIYNKQRYGEQIIFIAKTINNIKAKNYFIFKLHSPPSTPTEYYQGSKPANSMVLIVFIIFLALISSITLSFFLEYLHILKGEAPEKLWHLKQLLSFRDRKRC